mmetsp:Transcript_18847/g.47121  ORF Transcript_18847/g.47121 Transcript_18847/m.47121 type:complete len:218 (-) Transcript_18847:886-1539(-)
MNEKAASVAGYRGFQLQSQRLHDGFLLLLDHIFIRELQHRDKFISVGRTKGWFGTIERVSVCVFFFRPRESCPGGCPAFLFWLFAPPSPPRRSRAPQTRAHPATPPRLAARPGAAIRAAPAAAHTVPKTSRPRTPPQHYRSHPRSKQPHWRPPAPNRSRTAAHETRRALPFLRRPDLARRAPGRGSRPCGERNRRQSSRRRTRKASARPPRAEARLH